MIRKYDHEWTNKKALPEVRSGATKERVVVTGTTGALGSYLLAMLLESNNVEIVWALNRKSKEGLLARQKASFEDKMLDAGLLGSSKLVMLEGDLEDARLGLKEDVYQKVGSTNCGRKAQNSRIYL
jgi:thioester reductase-like protein